MHYNDMNKYSTMKKKLEELYIDAVYNDVAPNVFAQQVLDLFGVVNSLNAGKTIGIIGGGNYNTAMEEALALQTPRGLNIVKFENKEVEQRLTIGTEHLITHIEVEPHTPTKKRGTNRMKKKKKRRKK